MQVPSIQARPRGTTRSWQPPTALNAKCLHSDAAGREAPVKWLACLDTGLTFERKTLVLDFVRGPVPAYAAAGSALMPEKYHCAGVS